MLQKGRVHRLGSTQAEAHPQTGCLEMPVLPPSLLRSISQALLVFWARSAPTAPDPGAASGVSSTPKPCTSDGQWQLYVPCATSQPALCRQLWHSGRPGETLPLLTKHGGESMRKMLCSLLGSRTD